MDGQIKRATYFRLLIDKKTFNEIFNHCGTNKKNDVKEFLHIQLHNTQKCNEALSARNEFIRFIYKSWYMDITIRNITPKEGFLVQLERVIDCSMPYKSNQPQIVLIQNL